MQLFQPFTDCNLPARLLQSVTNESLELPSSTLNFEVSQRTGRPSLAAPPSQMMHVQPAVVVEQALHRTGPQGQPPRTDQQSHDPEPPGQPVPRSRLECGPRLECLRSLERLERKSPPRKRIQATSPIRVPFKSALRKALKASCSWCLRSNLKWTHTVPPVPTTEDHALLSLELPASTKDPKPSK